MMVETLEAKQKAADELVEIINKYSREDLWGIEVTDEIATIHYMGGGEHRVRIACDSVAMMIAEICRKICV